MQAQSLGFAQDCVLSAIEGRSFATLGQNKYPLQKNNQASLPARPAGGPACLPVW